MREIDIRVWCKSCKGISCYKPGWIEDPCQGLGQHYCNPRITRCNECKGEGLVWPEWEQLEFLFPEEKSNESKKSSNGGDR